MAVPADLLPGDRLFYITAPAGTHPELTNTPNKQYAIGPNRFNQSNKAKMNHLGKYA
jgi:hypothetical protein